MKQVKLFLILKISLCFILIFLSSCCFQTPWREYKARTVEEYFESFSKNEYLISENPKIEINPTAKTGIYTNAYNEKFDFELSFPVSDVDVYMDFENKVFVAVSCGYYDENMIIFAIRHDTIGNKFDPDVTTLYFYRQ